ncbi:MAG: [protein-PII] uridylyltransferase [Betaproteobacteria bacterium]|nr:[protein-PII] uridylyltransferase [Betaproteobacteria bacterium]
MLTQSATVAPLDSSRQTRLALATERKRLRERFAKSNAPWRVLRNHSQIVDRFLRATWLELRVPADAAMLAVGGYGRGELFPYSDVDVLILLPENCSTELSKKLEDLVGRLWDIGLEVGHAVRTVAQCSEEAAKDITVRTSLLEARLLAGNQRLYSDFRERTRVDADPHGFFAAKLLEQEQRHGKFQDSAYSLEPNIKEAPGGLRDLQILLWITRAAGLASSWKDMAERGFITPAEAGELGRLERFLQGLRVRLHYAAGRREDRLLFDFQDSLARVLGFKPTVNKRASEQLMQRYYMAAKSITQLNTILLQNLASALFKEKPGEREIINERFTRVRDLLEAASDDLFEREPIAIFESFLILQKRADLKGMTAASLRSLWRARSRIGTTFRSAPAHRAQFMEILQQPRGIVHELRRMNQYGILGNYLPAFRRIVGQMQHDLFHVYTVDQHILTVIRNLRRLTMLEFAHEYPLCSRLIAGFDRHWLLYVAALFHDIAKGRGGDHSELGKVEARRFCRDHGISKEDSSLVEFLVENHLVMSSVAQKQDLSDPEVVQRFVSRVVDERRLIALYLLTVADVRGTSPKVWNAWKGKLLEDLFRATRQVMRGGRIEPEAYLLEKQEEARRLLRLYALSDRAPENLWSRLDVAYFLRHDAREIAWQARLLHYRTCRTDPVVKARLSPAGDGLQVMIYVPDQPDLFARICGYFAAIGYSIVDAKVHTTHHGYALDTFQIMGTRQEPHYRDMISPIEHDLADRLRARTPLAPPTQGRISRQLRHFPITPEVHMRPDEKAQYQLLSITTGDRPGLLYSIARVLGLYRIEIHTAKIVTLGERAEDVFVISGAALNNGRTILMLEQELLEALQS